MGAIAAMGRSNKKIARKPLAQAVFGGIIPCSLNLAGPGVGQIWNRRQKGQCPRCLKLLGRREIEGDTANPGIAGPSGISGRKQGQPQS